MKSKKIIKEIVIEASIAAIYIVLTWVLSFMSYGPIQLRISEILVLLCFFNKKHLRGVLLGCFIANMFGPLGLVDAIIGTISTLIAGILITKCKKLFTASLMPSLTASIVGIELSYLYKTPMLLTIGQVMLGEAITVSIIGVLVMKILISQPIFKNSLLKEDYIDKHQIKSSNLLIAVMLILMFLGCDVIRLSGELKNVIFALFWPYFSHLEAFEVIILCTLGVILILFYLISAFIKKGYKALSITKIIIVSLMIILISIMIIQGIMVNYEIYYFILGCILVVENHKLILNI